MANNGCGLPFQISIISDKISQKKSTHRNLPRTLMNKTQKDIQRRRHHAPPQTPKRPVGFSFKSAQVWENFHKTGATTRSIGPRSTEPKNFKPRNGCIRLHAPPQTRDDPWPSPSNLCKFAYDFRKLTIPWSFTALDQQNPKISGPKTQARASTRRQKIRRWLPSIYAPPHPARCSHVPHAHTCRTCHTCPQRCDVMDDVILYWPDLSWFDPDRPANLTRSEPAKKKKKRKRKCFDQLDLWPWPKS